MNAAEGARETLCKSRYAMTAPYSLPSVVSQSVSGLTTLARAALDPLLDRQLDCRCASRALTDIVHYLLPLLLALAVSSVGHAGPFNPPLPGFFAMTSVGVRDDPSNLSGNLGAQNVYNAFTQVHTGYNPSYNMNLTELNTSAAGNTNQMAIQQGINAVSGVVTNGTHNGTVPVQDFLFIFYVNSHGMVLQYENGVNNRPLYLNTDHDFQTSPTGSPQYTGDHAIVLSNSDYKYDLTSSDLAAMFSGSQWQNVDKLFIIDTCYAGGMYTDLDGLKTLPHTGILAAADPTHRSWADDTISQGNGNTGILGQAVVKVLQTDNNLQNPVAYTGTLNIPGRGLAGWAEDLRTAVQKDVDESSFGAGRLEGSPDPNAPYDSYWNTSFPVNEQI